MEPGLLDATAALLFWASALLLAYTYLGYPLLLRALARGKSAPTPPTPQPQATLSLLCAMHNEAEHAAAKLRNTLASRYPRPLLQIVVADDGSHDTTLDELRRTARQLELPLVEYGPRDAPPPPATPFRPGLVLLRLETQGGKARALDRAAPYCQGQLLALSDADSRFGPQALERLARHFADPQVGCVGALYQPQAASGGLGAYWRYENALRRDESRFGGILGASGSLYMLRRPLFPRLEAALINDDFVVPLRIRAAGYRTLYDSHVASWEDAQRSSDNEFRRRIRVNVGNCQHAPLFLELLKRPGCRRLAFQLFSHKLLRLASPIAMLTLLGANAILARQGTGFWSWLLAAQLAFYLLALGGWLAPRALGLRGLLVAPWYFTMLNAAALAALARQALGAGRPQWNAPRNAAQGRS